MTLPTNTPPLRCAIYTRKSTAHHLERDYNSLESQREVCSAYITSQQHKGWMELPSVYEDAAQSGGNMDRPAMQRMLRDIEAGRINVIVIYKIDRLTRSIADFVRLMELLERFNVSFVSVTQSFDTSDSMGRMILNILLTFAQFEREMIADRIKDKFAAMRRRGKWTGGTHPLGYDVVDGRLLINESEAKQVRHVFRRFLELGSYSAVREEAKAAGMLTKCWTNKNGRMSGGTPVSNGMIYHMLGNCLYAGKVSYEGEEFEGEHDAIIDDDTWQAAKLLRARRAMYRPCTEPSPNILLGLFTDSHGRRMVIADERKCARRYRYYMSEQSRWATRDGLKRYRCKADQLEELVCAAIAQLLCNRELVRSGLLDLGRRGTDLETPSRNGKFAGRQLESATLEQKRTILGALIAHGEISRESIRLLIRCSELERFLMWDGTGLFQADRSAWHINEPTVLLDVPENVVRFERSLVMPIERSAKPDAIPNTSLVQLIREARKAQAMLDEERETSIAELAGRMHRQPGFFARVLRLNYLAPDIIASILDGTQPKGLTRKRLVNANLPMDWALQRQLLGYPARQDHQRGEERY